MLPMKAKRQRGDESKKTPISKTQSEEPESGMSSQAHKIIVEVETA